MRTLPKRWPHGRALAVSVNVMLEQWSDGCTPGLGPMGNPLKAGVVDTQAQSWAAYGPRSGAWRILDLLASGRTRAVFYVSGILAERERSLVKTIAAAGHAVAAHGWAQDILPAYQSVEDERAELVRSVEAIRGATGLAPLGFLSPRCTPSRATSRLLAAHGFLWHADFFDRDCPELMSLPEGRLVAMPFTIEVNDLPLTIRHGNEPDAFARTLETILSESEHLATNPACVDITVHAHIFGRPSGIAQLRKALGIVHAHDGAFLTTHADLATWCADA